MKKILLLLMMLPGVSTLMAQTLNQRVFDEKSQSDILVGYCNLSGLLTTPFGTDFAPNHDAYVPDARVTEQLNGLCAGITVVVILGTWCSDTREQLPRFIKITETLGDPFQEFVMIGVDRDKKAGDLDISRYKVEKVPVFIFMRGDSEIGRITETPSVTLEADMLNILKQP